MNFSTFDIVKALGIKRERLQQWLDQGFIKPSVAAAEGQGTRNVFTTGDVFLVGLFLRLTEFGINRYHAAAIISTFHHAGHFAELDDRHRYLWLTFKDNPALKQTPPGQEGEKANIARAKTEIESLPSHVHGAGLGESIPERLDKGATAMVVVDLELIRKKIREFTR